LYGLQSLLSGKHQSREKGSAWKPGKKVSSGKEIIMKGSVEPQEQGEQKEKFYERNPFVFLGGNLALDLVNTEKMVRGKKEELLATPQDVIQWWDMAQGVYSSTIRDHEGVQWDEQHIIALRELRMRLRHLFEVLATSQQLDERDVEALNAVLREGYYELNIFSEGKALAVYRSHQDTSILVPIAFAALQLLTEQDLSRLRVCQNDRCILLFYDTTRSATRHWCSISCTNRARSRQHYRQAKEASLPH
jgi:predicted RNA-binding Zn ribbon-like protein